MAWADATAGAATDTHLGAGGRIPTTLPNDTVESNRHDRQRRVTGLTVIVGARMSKPSTVPGLAQSALRSTLASSHERPA